MVNPEPNTLTLNPLVVVPLVVLVLAESALQVAPEAPIDEEIAQNCKEGNCLKSWLRSINKTSIEAWSINMSQPSTVPTDSHLTSYRKLVGEVMAG